MEDIEQEVYQKLFNLVLPAAQKDNYYMNYDKDKPLTLKEKMDILIKLNDKGWSIKHVVDNLAGVSWESYLEQTLYETEELKLQEKLDLIKLHIPSLGMKQVAQMKEIKTTTTQ